MRFQSPKCVKMRLRRAVLSCGLPSWILREWVKEGWKDKGTRKGGECPARQIPGSAYGCCAVAAVSELLVHGGSPCGRTWTTHHQTHTHTHSCAGCTPQHCVSYVTHEARAEQHQLATTTTSSSSSSSSSSTTGSSDVDDMTEGNSFTLRHDATDRAVACLQPLLDTLVLVILHFFFDILTLRRLYRIRADAYNSMGRRNMSFLFYFSVSLKDFCLTKCFLM